MSRGPYRRPKRLVVDGARQWEAGDTIIVGAVRWLIRSVSHSGVVKLVASNTVNHGIEWTTSLALLPAKETRS